MQIVDRAVRADGHAEDASDHLGLTAFVEAADHPDGRKRSVADVHQPHMRTEPWLHDQRVPPGPLDQPCEQLLTKDLLPFGAAEYSRTHSVPALRAAAAPSFHRLHEQVLVREARAALPAIEMEERIDAADAARAAIFGEAHLIVQWGTTPPLQQREDCGLGLEPLQIPRRTADSILIIKREDIIPGREHAVGEIEPELLAPLCRNALAMTTAYDASVAEREPQRTDQHRNRPGHHARNELRPFGCALRMPVAPRESRLERVLAGPADAEQRRDGDRQSRDPVDDPLGVAGDP